VKPTSNFSSIQCQMHVSVHYSLFPDFWTPEPNELTEVVIHQSFIYEAFFFVFYWRYNPLWVLAFPVVSFHSVLSLHNFLHPLIPVICISSSMSTIHLFLGLPLFLLPVGFHSSTFRYSFSFHPHHVTQPSHFAFYKSHYICVFY